jgi:23S rRNA U2552 (ribose-2'-O)-methylase RlmE/FtsJ
MSYYLLPRTNIFTHKCLDCLCANDNELPSPVISNSLSAYLYNIKEKIDKIEKEWDIYKKYTNTYEYIHTIVPNNKKSISKHKPLSRSYFKMIEIVNTFNIHFDSTKPICTFHLAEGPGGFIEAILKMRNNTNDTYIGMTILDDKNDYSIPAWKKTEHFLRQNKNVRIENGADKTGNILSLANFEYCKELYGGTMELITADGGFDFSVDFNNQEIHIAKLLFAQMCFAITMQKCGGSFILKVFDCFMQHTIDIIYILSSFYEKVYIIKPNTSRSANSEKYIICKNFLYSSSTQFYPYLYNAFSKMVNAHSHIYRFLNISIPYCFVTKLEEYNAIFGQQQIENIYSTISLIETKNKHDKIDSLIKGNIQKSINWCLKYNVEYQTILPNSNIFL